jgi:hypothetical protein
MVINYKLNKNKMGNRGSKQILLSNILKEQREDGI